MGNFASESKTPYSINKSHGRKHPGIGLDNVIKRLQILFPDRHQLDITDSEGKFKVRSIVRLEKHRMLRCILVDDESGAVEILIRYVDRTPEIELIRNKNIHVIFFKVSSDYAVENYEKDAIDYLSDNFIRVQRSFVVAVDKLDALDSIQVTFYNRDSKNPCSAVFFIICRLQDLQFLRDDIICRSVENAVDPGDILSFLGRVDEKAFLDILGIGPCRDEPEILSLVYFIRHDFVVLDVYRHS
jgi:hypothetical protein